MIPSAAEQLKWIQLSHSTESPMGYASFDEGQQQNPMVDLLMDNQILSSAVDRIPDVFSEWQKEPYLTQALSLANFDPDEAGMGEMMRLFENESRVLLTPHLSCKEKASLSTTIFHAGVTMRDAVDRHNYAAQAMERAVGFMLPDHIRFLQGDSIQFDPPIPGGRTLSTHIWIPPSLNRVQSEIVRGGKRNGLSQTYTTYSTPVQIRPLGSENPRHMQVAYRSDMLIPQLA